jgi:hypothetical protein
VNAICALDALGVAIKVVGAGGGPVGIASLAAVYVPIPEALLPATLKLYEIPFTNPVTVSIVVGAVGVEKVVYALSASEVFLY